MKKNKAKFLSIDIGGTGIEVCKFDKNYKLVFCLEMATKNLPVGSVKFINSIRDILAENFDKNIKKIGVGFNCVVKDGKIIYSSILGGRADYPLEKNFFKFFGVPVKLQNDVNAMAVAECKFNKSIKGKSFVLVNLGTGIRASFVHNGKLVEGFSGNAGEISQKKVSISDISKEKFLLDDVASGKGLSNIYYKLTNNKYDAKKIFSISSHNKDAKKAVDIFVEHFSRILEDISYFYNPEKIIINGSTKRAAEIFLPKAIKLYKSKVNPLFYFKSVEISKIEYAACLGTIIQ